MIAALLGVLVLLIWMGFEVIFRAPGEASSWQADRRDSGSTAILIAAFLLALALPAPLSHFGIGVIGQAAWLGIVIAGSGLLVRGWSMRTLGSSYTRTLRTAADQRLVTNGPYRWVRHPGYSGSIAVWVGAALAFHNWLAAAIVALLMLAAYGWRIHAEERMLRAAFGQEFREYSARTSKLFPGLY
jgi:protein-S-isoprenylcysteine O-methyltransferase Ste14